jgi:hypothetical protein
MNDEAVFQPERRTGTWVHLAAIVVLFMFSLVGLWLAGIASGAWVFLLYALSAGVFSLIPLVAYWLYGLRTAAYTVARDGLRIRWGLRMQELSIEDVLWIRPASELGAALPLPRVHWPGSLVGKRNLADGSQVEYLAAGPKNLLVVATPDYGYAISPADPEGYLLAYQRCIEMGSLAPWAGRAVYPTFLMARVWQARPARFLLLGGILLSLGLLVWVGAITQTQPQITLTTNAFGRAGEPIPSARLMLLPVLNGLFFLADLFLGLFFFRRPESQSYAYLVWGAGVLTAGLFLIGMWAVI